jgi:MFS family permease
VLRLPNTSVQLVLLCVGASNFFWVPMMGHVSDKVGRRPVLFAVGILTILTAYPALSWLASGPSFARLLVVELWLSCMFGSYSGAMVAYLIEIMPPEVRTSGFSVAFSLATAIFGGFTPAICTYLIEVTGNKAVPGLWLSFAAAIGLIAAVLLTRTTSARQPEPASVGAS